MAIVYYIIPDKLMIHLFKWYFESLQRIEVFLTCHKLPNQNQLIEIHASILS